ncbi:MaoC family dehydratase [Ottowia pentelensis]|uniref:MaoC family dehydratase n=1 Tax=Ottowia pentelensis TaxID=511108 RepID=A0ABV6PPV9_9BURK|nr:MaoC family dehydratase [Ottowia sp.]
MAIEAYSLRTLPDFVGKELGVSGWVRVDQPRIDQFAECTGDHQWIHVDPKRASAESPYGGTIAHGFLTLSMVATMAMEVGIVPADARAGLNYGMDKLRFMAPVKAGARVRCRVELMSAEDKGGGNTLIKTRNTLEIEGEGKPALVAEMLAMLIQ